MDITYIFSTRSLDIDMNDENATQKEALTVGLALVRADWKGKSDFDKGMRLLQRHLRKPKERRKLLKLEKEPTLL